MNILTIALSALGLLLVASVTIAAGQLLVTAATVAIVFLVFSVLMTKEE